MRATTTAEMEALEARHRRVLLRAFVEDGEGQMRDLTDLEGTDWLDGVEVERDMDQPVASATLHLHRAVDGVSLAPLVEQSPANRDGEDEYAPLVMPGRAARIEVKVAEPGDDPATYDWVSLFEGVVDDVGWGGSPSVLRVPLRDAMGRLRDRWVEELRHYGDDESPVPIEDVMQSILDDVLGQGEVTLEVVGDPDFGIVRYQQQRESLLDALQAHADLIGWDLRYRWHEGSGEWRLTFQEPDRDQGESAHTFGPDDYYDVVDLRLTSEGVRNVVDVLYLDADGEPQRQTTTEQGSIDEFGRRYLLLDALDDRSIRGQDAATALGEAVARDLAEPLAHQETENAFFWPAELGDLLTWEANGVHYDADQDLAVTGIRHVLSRDQHATFFRVRGAPSGGFRRWFRRARKITSRIRPHGTVEARREGDTVFFEADGNETARSFSWGIALVSSVGELPTDPDDPSLESSGHEDSALAEVSVGGIEPGEGEQVWVVVWFHPDEAGEEPAGPRAAARARVEDAELPGNTVTSLVPRWDPAPGGSHLAILGERGEETRSVRVEYDYASTPGGTPDTSVDYTFDLGAGGGTFTHAVEDETGAIKFWDPAEDAPQITLTPHTEEDGGGTAGTSKVVEPDDPGETGTTGGRVAPSDDPSAIRQGGAVLFQSAASLGFAVTADGQDRPLVQLTGTATPAQGGTGTDAVPLEGALLRGDAQGAYALISPGAEDAVLKMGAEVPDWGSVAWDEIDDIPDTFPPESHASSHHSGGSDPLDVTDLAGLPLPVGSGGTGSTSFPTGSLVVSPGGNDTAGLTGTDDDDVPHWDSAGSQWVTKPVAGALPDPGTAFRFLRVDSAANTWEESSWALPDAPAPNSVLHMLGTRSGGDAEWVSLQRSDLPSAVAYEDEANVFSEDLRLNNRLRFGGLVSSLPSDTGIAEIFMASGSISGLSTGDLVLAPRTSSSRTIRFMAGSPDPLEVALINESRLVVREDLRIEGEAIFEDDVDIQGALSLDTPLAADQGGTGLADLVGSGRLLMSTDASTWSLISPGSQGDVLTMGGTGLPEWQDAPVGDPNAFSGSRSWIDTENEEQHDVVVDDGLIQSWSVGPAPT